MSASNSEHTTELQESPSILENILGINHFAPSETDDDVNVLEDDLVEDDLQVEAPGQNSNFTIKASLKLSIHGTPPVPSSPILSPTLSPTPLSPYSSLPGSPPTSPLPSPRKLFLPSPPSLSIAAQPQQLHKHQVLINVKTETNVAIKHPLAQSFHHT